MMLRYRILKEGIRCFPWKIWKGEIDLLPVSAKTLFMRMGTPIDLLERTLQGEGYLFKGESLLEALKLPETLKRTPCIIEEDASFGLAPDDWTEDDWIYHEKTRSI